LRQFIVRTVRIGNKESFLIFEYDKDAKNSSAEVFFKNKIEELKNNAIIDLSINVSQKIKKVFAKQEEDKSSASFAGIKRYYDESAVIEDEILS
jgi:hypothetical protein